MPTRSLDPPPREAELKNRLGPACEAFAALSKRRGVTHSEWKCHGKKAAVRAARAHVEGRSIPPVVKGLKDIGKVALLLAVKLGQRS